jgi:hypothetical protein
MEMMITMALTLFIMASTLGAMNNALRASNVAELTTNMNQGLRTAMDIMVRDMLQVGQGLPSGRTIDIPNGTGSTELYLPGAPGTTRRMPKVWDTTTGAWKAAEEMTAIVPGPGLGPTINGVATDVITIVLADGAFLSTISDYDVNLTKLCTSGRTMTVDPSVDISNGGADDLHAGDLIMLMKGSATTLLQVTTGPSSAVDAGQSVTFAAGDSLGLNQTAAANGTLAALVGVAPADTCTATTFQPTTATRIRMITYYIDTTSDPSRPRLVRRVNNGDPATYNNALGTALAFDVDNLQISYDLVDGVTNPAGVEFTSADLSGTGACSPNPCSPNQIRKINLTLSGRSRTPQRQTRQYLRNTLTTQVSLRSMSFIDRYR